MSLVSLSNKIALGTVQLGLPYGISNTTGKPDQEEADRILNFALDRGINMLDSAEAYGDSLHVIGSYLNKHAAVKFDIINKFTVDCEPILNKFNASLNILNRKNLYAYMYHRFADYKLGESKLTLRHLKEEGKVKKIGVSVYDDEELKLVVDDYDIDLVQVPFNIFDASTKKMDLIKVAKSNRKEIHVRSIFLQGLFFKEPNDLTGNIDSLAQPLRQFHKIINKYNISVNQACINFALHNIFIDKVIIGVEREAQLKENLEAIMIDFPVRIVEEFESIKIIDQLLLNPSNWRY